MEAVRQQSAEPRPVESRPVVPRLGLWDAVSLIVGIIIGVGIFATPAEIFAKVPNPLLALGVWFLGGVLALMGAFCFAELASTYPRSGGEYVYLTRSFGSLAGFLFAWAQLAVIRPGSIGVVAYIFALYANQLLGNPGIHQLFLATLAVVVLTGINILGVTLGKQTQNLLTVLKVLGLGGIIVVGFGWGQPRFQEATQSFSGERNWFAGAMFLVLWSYSGWHEAGYVAAEVRNNRRNLPLAIFLGTGLVTVVYLLINVAYWFALGYSGTRTGELPTEVLQLAWGSFASNAMAVFIIISALGCINGMIFTTARLNAAFGADHRLFEPLSRWSSRQTPVVALLVEAGICMAMIVAVGVLGAGKTTLESMIDVTNGVFWFFFLVTGLALFVLRKKDAGIYRPFRVPLYPVMPILFCAWCAFMVYASLGSWYSLLGLAILIAGLPFYFVPRKKKLSLPTDIGSREVAAV
ncbi:MAG: amino acid permease [Planctomycetes bacterium]|nr:amino acid permease [Planctomycetota bacterium]